MNEIEEVVEQENEQTIPAKRAARQNNMPKWELSARENVRKAIKKHDGSLKDLLERDANEADTRMFVTEILCEGLGYDRFSDLNTEYRIRGEYADYAIRMDSDVYAFVEVKRVNTKLGTKHLRQVQSYAVNEGVEWLILTNGAQWQVYHITGGLPVLTELAMEIDLVNGGTTNENADGMFYISKKALQRGKLADLWQAKHATSPKSLAAVMLSECVLSAVRKELRRATGYSIDVEDVERILRTSCLRDECFDNDKKR